MQLDVCHTAELITHPADRWRMAFCSTDEFASNGQCKCNTALGETQDPRSNFGCLTNQGSAVSRRKRLAIDRRQAGVAPKPYFLNNREAAPVPALAQPAEVAVKAPKISLPLLSGLEEIEAM